MSSTRVKPSSLRNIFIRCPPPLPLSEADASAGSFARHQVYRPFNQYFSGYLAQGQRSLPAVDGRDHERRYLTRATTSNIGMYSAMTMPPTTTPSVAIMSGSMSEVSPSTPAVTSSS